MINHELNNLISFALHHELITPEDKTWAANSLIGILGLNSFEFENESTEQKTFSNSPDSILSKILDWAAENNLIENTETERDLLDTKLMGVFTPRPSDVIEKFNSLEKISPVDATNYFYKLGVSSNYIRSERTAKNICWKTSTEFGELDITINMSKPEKDPRDIAKARAIKSSGYPKCLLCKENEGFYGHHGHPARQNIRLIPLKLNGRNWYFQYSPYSYYNEHCIVLDENHVPMLISRETFENLFAFIERFPHYFVGSNADLPIVGGSILSHDHYQGGRYVFAMDGAPFEKEYRLKDPEITAGRIKWPMSAIRLSSKDPEKLTDLAEKILSAWREWTDESAGILAYSDGEPHNTITPIARRRGENFELDLVLRNNRTSEEHPLGIFHPHAEVHHIKKENIGLIEVMGLAVLPARLKPALEKISAAWLENKNSLPSELEAHEVWYKSLRKKHEGLTGRENVKKMLRDEVGHVFAQVLRDSGVYKRDAQGLAAFDKFAESVLL
ncbi:MAG: UDP-glucose--hexose-1-phosphate uridylyltransferase [Synergistales bacterium]|nr:UDP-glucose--hexose-1-phosphate uridylyltransferase [Synergistales bacterium]MDY6401378.1 UDP-glucose--hexose-1-phosphate uridylyltransferase [Synergistales bacterium]MDY6405053.1 UDP-glucose--hexose-1-phosphate uridylyltransferase [Synergistales bacterium]MDY6410124.1 UDP-glucose--hexose-1-phosphate uridylyltransferase [Synergistales bacterium]MDY6413912.1 UDP-glucose--hexose-1-phosphate uridylyltransferase [Synergistales bacterium]